MSMARRHLAAWLLAVPLLAAAVEPPSDAEMQQHREKAELWASRGLSCDQVLANLRGWFGRLFIGEQDVRAGTCDVYVLTHQWVNSLNRQELIHRFKVATVPQ